jgi:hypothetical protein
MVLSFSVVPVSPARNITATPAYLGQAHCRLDLYLALV